MGAESETAWLMQSVRGNCSQQRPIIQDTEPTPASCRKQNITIGVMAPPELDHLLRILKERDTALGHDDVAWAFENVKTDRETKDWMNEYLTPVSLLTKEELAFHERRPTSSSRPLAKSAAGGPISDAEFERAISSLESSTAAIEKQCKLLERQKSALKAMRTRAGGDASTEQAQTIRQKKLTRERAQLEFESSEMTGSLQSRLQASSKQVEVAVAGLPSGVDRLLEKDDRILDRIQKIIPRLVDKSPDGAAELTVEKLCLALITLSAQEIRHRIDAAYTSCLSASTDEHINGASQKQTTSLHAELAELSGEIDSLAVMAVDGRYRHPIARDLKSSRSEAEIERVKWTDYVVATFRYLIARLDALTDHTQHLHAYQSALRHLTATLDAMTAAAAAKEESQAAAAGAAGALPSTPSQTKGLRTLRLVQANLSETQDAALALARHLDVKITDPGKLAEVLEQTCGEREERLESLSRGTARAMADQMAETMNKADKDVQDLLGAVFAYAKFATVNIRNMETQEMLDQLEKQTQLVGDEMRSLDVDRFAATIKRQQQMLKTKWG
nr:hypothetical protein CFP56_20924 [Quercus suber]